MQFQAVNGAANGQPAYMQSRIDGHDQYMFPAASNIYRMNKSFTRKVNEEALIFGSKSSSSSQALTSAAPASTVNHVSKDHVFLSPSSSTQQYLGHHHQMKNIHATPAAESSESSAFSASPDSSNGAAAPEPCCCTKERLDPAVAEGFFANLSMARMSRRNPCKKSRPAEGEDSPPEIPRLSLRTCTLCGTTKTPLWRSGPGGPKSLCNACGIRAKKNRKLQALQSAAEDQHLGDPVSTPILSIKKSAKRKLAAVIATSAVDAAGDIRGDENPGMNGRCQPHPRRLIKGNTKLTTLTMVGAGDDNIHLNSTVSVEEDRGSCPTSPSTPSPSKRRPNYAIRNLPVKRKATAHPLLKASSHQKGSFIFSKDDEQAAFLLMALSCGLVLA